MAVAEEDSDSGREHFLESTRYCCLGFFVNFGNSLASESDVG